MDQSSHSFELESESASTPTSLNSSDDSDDLFSPPSSEYSSDSESDDDSQIREEAKKAVKFETNLVELHVGLLKNACKKKVETLRHVKIEVKEELKEGRDENARLKYQVGFNEGKAEFLAQENEVFTA